MGSGRIHAVPLTTLLAIAPTDAVRIQAKTKAIDLCGLRRSFDIDIGQRPRRAIAGCLLLTAKLPQHLAHRHPPGKPFETIMGDLFNVLTVKLRIRGPQPKSMLRTKRHCRKHLVAPCVPDLRLEKIGLNTHGLRISPGERLQKDIAAPLHFLILCHGSRASSWRGRRCARNFIRSSSRWRHWL